MRHRCAGRPRATLSIAAGFFALAVACASLAVPARADYTSYFPYFRHSKPSPTPSPSATPSASPSSVSTGAPLSDPAAFQLVKGRSVGANGPGAGGPNDLRLDAVGSVQFALRHSPTVLERVATLAADISTFGQRRAAEYPAIVAQLENQIQKSANLSGTLAQYGITPTSNFSQNTAQISAQYNLYNGGATLAAKEARRQAESDAQQLEIQRETTTTQVTNAFYDLAARHGAVNVAENDLRYQQALLAAALASERVGRVAGVDVLKAQVAVTRSQSTLVQARADEANAGESLGVLIGASPETSFALPDPLPEPAMPKSTPEQLATLAKSTRPEIRSALASFQVAKLADATIDSDLRPTVQVNGSFGSQVSPTNLVSEQQQIDQQNASLIANYELEKSIYPNSNIPPPTLFGPVDRHLPGFWQFSVTSTFQVPVIDYGQRALEHKAASAQMDAALAQLENSYDSVEADVRASFRNAQAALEKLGLAKASAKLARESARIANLQYQNGLVSFTDVSDTEQTAVSAENDLVVARVAYIDAYVKLRVALGPPNPASATDLRGL